MMIERLAGSIVESQIRKNNIPEESRDLYRYSYLVLISEAVNLIAAWIIGMIFGDVPAVLIFLLFFIPLRRFSGGLHARSPESCACISGLILCGVCLLNRIAWGTGAGGILFAAGLMCALVIWWLSPAEAENKPLDETEKKRYRMRSHQILAVEIFILAAAFVLQFSWIARLISMGHIVLGVSVAGQWVLKR